MSGLKTGLLPLTVAGAIALATSPACAQDETEAAASQVSASGTGEQRRVFTPEDLARFAPRSALDLLEQVPGFQIESEDGERGLGQASGNVLINGRRLSSKSESARDQLGRISIDNVVRIEILDGTTLDIPGLTGQVANVVVEAGGLSGQFEYSPQFRQVGGPALLDGSISISGASGPFEYQLAFNNEDDVGASRGPSLRFDGAGNLIEQRFSDNERRTRSPKISGNFGWSNDNGVVANATLSHQWTFFRNRSDELRTDGAGDNARFVDRTTDDDAVRYEVGGDVAFPALGGTLKLIGLASGDDSDFVSTELLTLDADGSLSGARFAQLRESGERIGRAEFTWSGGGADWQLAGEAAYNTLGQVARLFEIDPGGNFGEIDFPAGVGGVSEDRYEASLSYGRPLSATLSLQATAAVERSTLTQTGSAAASRTFLRPKGSASLAWSAQDDLDLTFSVRRRVGQLQFGDFLARVFLGDDRENAGNNELRPPQSWEFELEARKDFGRWGNASLRLFDYHIEDLVDVILVDGGQSPGNIASARRTGVEFNGTLELAPLGIGGARIDAGIDWQRARLDDPLTGLARAISNADPYRIDIDYRHDIPGSDIAYGASVFLSGDEPFFRITESGFERNGPAFGGIFVEHKDLFGLTVNVRIGNPYLGGDTSIRTVYEGPRNASPILFVEERDREFGRSVRLSVKGSF